MIEITVFLGICLVIYAFFSYLESVNRQKISSADIEREFFDQHRDEIIEAITKDFTSNLNKLLLADLKDITELAVLEEMMGLVNKEKITKAGTENNKEFTEN